MKIRKSGEHVNLQSCAYELNENLPTFATNFHMPKFRISYDKCVIA